MKLSRLVFLALIAVAIVWPIRIFVLEPIYIATASMEPTLKVGAHLFLDKLTYRFRSPKRGEIIAFLSPIGNPHDSVKRVIAVGGDTVEIKEKIVWVNGQKISEPYVQHTRPDEILEGDNLGPIEVFEDSLFVLGDNRDESGDSATWKDPETQERIYFVDVSSVRGTVRGFY